ncbi:MAG: alanine racemase, partial [Rickettsiales bacterium]|nr:alanine racemase [Rickettsiales bacterium]
YLLFRELTGQGKNCIPVVKANAYGLGVLEVVDTLLSIDDPQRDFFVYSLEEACDIRLNFGDRVGSIYVLRGLITGQENIFVKYRATPVINSLEQLKIWSEYAQNIDRELDAVLQFNTGINRSGIQANLAPYFRDFAADRKNRINLAMVMGHVGCQCPLDSSLGQQYTVKELDNFKKIASSFPYVRKSLAETRCALYIAGSLYDCSRIGIGLFTFEREKIPKIGTALTIVCPLECDEKTDEVYINFGKRNGLAEEYGRNGFVYVDGKKIRVERLEDYRTILDFDGDVTSLASTAALLVGHLEGSHIDGFEFSRMNGSIPEEFFATILAVNRDSCSLKIGTRGCKFDAKNRKTPPSGLSEISVEFDSEGRLVKLTSVVSEKRIVDEDGFCGYGATELVRRGDLLITVSIGYLGGFSRRISGTGARIFVKNSGGKIFPCVLCGVVSMDQICARTNRENFDEIEIGDRVVVIDDSAGIGDNWSRAMINIPLLLV